MTANENRSADKFVVRLKPGQRDQLKARAKADNQTMNETAITAIEKHLARSEAFDRLLKLAEQAITAEADAVVTIKREHLQRLAKFSELTKDDQSVVAAITALGGDL